MCAALGNEPVESEIPVEYDDLSDDVQEALMVYNMLQDNWDGMNGVYMGKVMSGISDVFSIAEIEDRKTCFAIIQIIDNIRSSIINAKKPAK
jgi:hypothetical protein